MLKILDDKQWAFIFMFATNRIYSTKDNPASRKKFRRKDVSEVIASYQDLSLYDCKMICKLKDGRFAFINDSINMGYSTLVSSNLDALVEQMTDKDRELLIAPIILKLAGIKND